MILKGSKKDVIKALRSIINKIQESKGVYSGRLDQECTYHYQFMYTHGDTQKVTRDTTITFKVVIKEGNVG